MSLPLDILYDIYLKIDDYETLINFETLNKKFYKDYISRYNMTYKHKFKILKSELFKHYQNLDDDIDEFDIWVKLANKININIIKDILFVYKLYKNVMFNKIMEIFPKNLSLYFTHIMLKNQHMYIKNNIIIEFNKNKVALKFYDKYEDDDHASLYTSLYTCFYPFFQAQTFYE